MQTFDEYGQPVFVGGAEVRIFYLHWQNTKVMLDVIKKLAAKTQ